jgi:hypothetical protein
VKIIHPYATFLHVGEDTISMVKGLIVHRMARQKQNALAGVLFLANHIATVIISIESLDTRISQGIIRFQRIIHLFRMQEIQHV